MNLFSPALSLFHPEDEGLSSETKMQIQLHRLLSLLGAVFVPLFGVLHAHVNSGAVDPMWARLGIAGLLASLLAASYVSERVRRHYVRWLQGLLYVLMGWFVVIAALNRFVGSYASGLLFLFAVLVVVMGVGAQSIRTVLWFSGFGLLLTAGGAALGPAPRTSPVVLLASMAVATLLEGLVILTYLSTREKLREREKRFESPGDRGLRLGSNGGDHRRCPCPHLGRAGPRRPRAGALRPSPRGRGVLEPR